MNTIGSVTNSSSRSQTRKELRGNMRADFKNGNVPSAIERLSVWLNHRICGLERDIWERLDGPPWYANTNTCGLAAQRIIVAQRADLLAWLKKSAQASGNSTSEYYSTRSHVMKAAALFKSCVSRWALEKKNYEDRIRLDSLGQHEFSHVVLFYIGCGFNSQSCSGSLWTWKEESWSPYASLWRESHSWQARFSWVILHITHWPHDIFRPCKIRVMDRSHL